MPTTGVPLGVRSELLRLSTMFGKNREVVHKHLLVDSLIREAMITLDEKLVQPHCYQFIYFSITEDDDINNQMITNLTARIFLF